jgi:hypothetical protein
MQRKFATTPSILTIYSFAYLLENIEIFISKKITAYVHIATGPRHNLFYISGRGLFGFAKKFSKCIEEITLVFNKYYPKIP